MLFDFLVTGQVVSMNPAASRLNTILIFGNAPARSATSGSRYDRATHHRKSQTAQHRDAFAELLVGQL
jgi:hypothetical protein